MSEFSAGIPVVITGPSGAGKGTVVTKILEADKTYLRAKSATTRQRRHSDPNDTKYIFYSRDEFKKAIDDSKVIEYTMYAGNYYGTLCDQIDSCLDADKNVILEIDVRGAVKIKQLYPCAVLIWLMPSNFHELEMRLRGRATENEESLSQRLAEVKTALGYYYCFDYVVINRHGEADDAAKSVMEIVRSEKRRVSRNMTAYKQFYDSIPM